MSAESSNPQHMVPFAPCLASHLLSVFSRLSLLPIMGQKTFPQQKGPPLTIFLHLSCLFPDELLIWCW